MTRYTWFFLILAVFLSVAYFAPKAGIGVETHVQVAALSPRAIEVLEENGYEVPESARTGVIKVDSDDPTKMLTFMWNCLTFDVDNVPVWLATFFFGLTLILLLIAVPILIEAVKAAAQAVEAILPWPW